MNWGSVLDAFLRELADIEPVTAFGRVRAVHGALIEVAGPLSAMHVGVRVRIAQAHRADLVAEVIGFRDQTALCLPFGVVEGLRAGAEATIEPHSGRAFPSKAWLGRVVDAMGEPADGKGALPQGLSGYLLRASPPRASERRPVGGPIDLGVKALNTFVTCCRGQRMGIFAGSGVGKSVLLSMLARYTQSGVAVIGLIGERGREVQEFITENLGEEGLKRSVVVVATSDESALARRQAAYMTLTLAEYFRDQGEHVLCMIDSITRFAQAQREVGLAIGEPPTTRGYVPSVFTELPRLLERAGPGSAEGAITGLFTVLIEGDDHNEPIADAVRGILDGHIVMERSIAERGRYPAINVLKSVSRTMPGCVAAEHRPLLARAKQLLGTYADMEELIRLGAYRKGSSPDVDEAIAYQPRLEAFLSQAKDECVPLAQGYQHLAQVLDNQGTH